MPKEMKHLNLFPAGLPKDEAMIVVNGLRGIDDGKSKRDRVEAAWWVSGYGLSFIPEEAHQGVASAAPMSATQAADQLESLINDPSMKAIPWSLLLPLITQLLMKWLA